MSSRKLVVAAAAVSITACGSVAAQRDVTCGATAVQVLPNGSFDLATPAWVQDPPTPTILCGTDLLTPVDGTKAACLGGTDGKIMTVTQDVPLPEGVKKATLSGQICITTQEPADAPENDTLQIQLLDGTSVLATFGQFSNKQGSAQCVFMAFAPLAVSLTSDPANATLQLRTTLNTLNPTSFFLDALKLDASCTQ